MAVRPAESMARHIGKLVAARRYGRLTDRELLRYFTKEHEVAAFEHLLQRHAPMVLNVCQRVLHNGHDADDVFQATFLVLLKKAGALARRDSVAGWLHEAAYRLAVKAKSAAIRRGIVERSAPVKACHDPGGDMTVREAQACLHEELQRLPEQLRAPLVLCYLQGTTQDEAARQLGWSLRTFKRRLARGRSLLEQRLTRRGITLAAVLSTGLLPVAATSAGLAQATVKAAVAMASGPARGAVSASVSVLVDEALRGMLLAKMKIVAAVVLIVGLLGTSFALIGRSPPAAAADGAQRSDRLAKHAVPVATAQTKPTESEPSSDRPATDRFGDALPENAVARMGSLRFQHGQMVERMHFSPDGARILLNGRFTNRLFDTMTGKEFKLAEGFVGNDVCTAGKQVLFVMPRRGQGRAAGIWNLETGQLVRAIDVNFHGGSVDPKGKFAVMNTRAANGTTFQFLDLESGKFTEPVLAEGVGQVDHYWFSADGKRLVTTGLKFPKGYSFAAWDVPAGRLLQYPALGKASLNFVCCLSPDGTTIGNISGDDDRVDLHDVTTLELSASFKVPRKTRLLGAAISPDGRTAAAFSQYTIYLWDRKTGKELRQIPGHGSMDRRIAFAPDGKRIAAAESTSVTLFDVATGAPCHQFGHTYAVYRLLFAPDGKKLYSAAGYRDSSVRVWNPLTGELVEQLQGHTAGLSNMAMSLDGRLLVTSSQDRTIRVWDRQLAKELVRLDEKTWGHFVSFLPDGKKFVSAERGEVRLHDAATGNVVARFEAPEKSLGLFTHGTDLWLLDNESNMLQAIDLASGKVRHKLKVPEDRFGCYVLAPDGKRIAVGHSKGTIRVMDIQTGDEQRQLTMSGNGTNFEEMPMRMAFTPDGELLAVGSVSGKVSLWELASGKERAIFQGHRREVICFTFSPDRTLLVSGGSDTTIVAWDLYGLHAGARHKPAPAMLDKLWDDLGHADPVKAYAAIKGFCADAATTTKFFAKKHKPLPKIDDQVLHTWIRQLDSADFKLREEGVRELKAALRQAEPLLRKALAKQPTPEFAHRARQLLAELDLVNSPDRLRRARAAEILSVLGTPAARELLQAIDR